MTAYNLQTLFNAIYFYYIIVFVYLKPKSLLLCDQSIFSTLYGATDSAIQMIVTCVHGVGPYWDVIYLEAILCTNFMETL